MFSTVQQWQLFLCLCLSVCLSVSISLSLSLSLTLSVNCFLPLSHKELLSELEWLRRQSDTTSVRQHAYILWFFYLLLPALSYGMGIVVTRFVPGYDALVFFPVVAYIMMTVKKSFHRLEHVSRYKVKLCGCKLCLRLLGLVFFFFSGLVWFSYFCKFYAINILVFLSFLFWRCVAMLIWKSIVFVISHILLLAFFLLFLCTGLFVL